jgi:uncharacterized protein (TIGR04255 family)
MRNCYRKPFLKKVIVRIDLATPLESLKKAIHPQLTKNILASFPISEPKKAVIKQFQISPQHKESNEITSEEKYWFYHSKNREKTICLAQNFVFVEYNQYKSYEELQEDFLSIVHLLVSLYDAFQISRLGLRYINHIELNEKDFFNWKKYLKPKLLYNLSLPKERCEIIRVFNNFTISDGDMILQFRYGMHNPDFPAFIKKKLFILDLDAFQEGLIDVDYIENGIDKYHDAIEKQFEDSITDNLRRKMGIVNNGKR